MSMEEAKDILWESTPADTILDIYLTGSYIEFTCRAGGDVCTYRVYNNGTITERQLTKTNTNVTIKGLRQSPYLNGGISL